MKYLISTGVITLLLSACIPGMMPPLVQNDESAQPVSHSPPGYNSPVFNIGPIIVNGVGEVEQRTTSPTGTAGQTTKPGPVIQIPVAEPKVHSYPFPDKGDPHNELPPVTNQQRQLGTGD